MKILTADLHIHDHFNNPIFINIGVDYLEYLSKYAKKNNIKEIEILGDLFHISSKINTEIFLPIFKQFEKMKEDGLIINIIPGNHELHQNNQTETILYSLKPYCNIINEYSYIQKNNITYHYLPFKREIDFSQIEIQENINILFSHYNIAGFKLNEKMTSKGITLKDEFINQFKFIFLGDLHIHQTIKNMTYCGSPYQQNWGEVGQKKGFIVLDEENLDWKFIEYKNAPKFKIMSVEKALTEKIENSFIKLEIDSKIDNLSKLREILYDKGAINITQEFIQKKEENTENEDILKTLDTNKNLDDIIQEFIEQDNTQLDKIKLNKLFKKIIL